jgi:hypothetical protein
MRDFPQAREGRATVATKLIPVVLDRQLYQQLERQARQEDRTPVGQARYLLRQALEAQDRSAVAVTRKEVPA